MSGTVLVLPIPNRLVLREEQRSQAIGICDIASAVVAHVNHQALALTESGKDPIDIGHAETVGETRIKNVAYPAFINRAIIHPTGHAVVPQIKRLKAG